MLDNLEAVCGRGDKSNRGTEKHTDRLHGINVCAMSILVPTLVKGTTLWKFAIAQRSKVVPWRV